jgi:hypothetical protein
MARVIACAGLIAALALPASAGALSGFQSPSGNIGCSISKRLGVRCDIREREWSVPPKPRSCDFDWDGSLNLDKRGKAKFLCVSDTVFGLGGTLPYGDQISRGRFTCKSRTTGVRCVNRRNGHGFRVSRQSVKRF